MSGWLTLLLLVALGVGLLWLLGLRGAMLQAGAAALLLGAAGYAWQGRPGLSGSPAEGRAADQVIPLSGARHAFFGEFTGSESWLRMSESLASRGNTEDAARLLQAAVRRHPNDVQLWIGLGNALVDQAHGLTPPAELAYRRAAELAPGHPAPAFFMGLALARSGQREEAIRIWRQILATAPPKASWRPLIEGGIAAMSKPGRAPQQSGR